jgi:cell wall-associated NlpC family hydrolase
MAVTDPVAAHEPTRRSGIADRAGGRFAATGDISRSAQPGAPSHVGLYVGEGSIHSSNTGVRLSRLERDDPDGKY